MKRLILPLAGLIAAGTALAYPERPALENALRETTEGLLSLARQRSDSLCQGDVEIAATYLKTAAMKVHHQRFALALTDLDYSQRELKAIATARDWCRDMAPKALPFIPKVWNLKAQVEGLSRVQE